jgi:protein SCO1
MLVARLAPETFLMNANFRRTQFFVWGFLLLVIFVIIGAFIFSKLDTGKPLLIYGQVENFSLTNQNNETVSLEKLRGQIWIADVIFTRCPLQCIRMTKRMHELQEVLPSEIKFVSVTADPGFDRPDILKNYANEYGADQSRWLFLTGLKTEINRLVVESLKLVIYEKKPEEREVPADLFLHSTRFVLVDQQGRVRGWFDGENAESKPEIVHAVKTLLRETK